MLFVGIFKQNLNELGLPPTLGTMGGAGRAEIYFIAAMMVLIMILSVGAVVIFWRTYKKEMREKEARKLSSETPKTADDA
jgi:flagellar basal body-associated protein FliL